MGKRILYLVLVSILGVGGYYAYQHYKMNKMEADGDVQCTGCLTPEQEEAFKKRNSGETADGSSDSKTRPASQATTSSLPSTPVTAYPAPVTTAARGVYPAAPAAPPASNLPVSDTQSPKAPDGLRFSGSGGYQWYRQGNLTWRVNTQTGASCIIYATMEEWHKPIVLQHGCGRSS